MILYIFVRNILWVKSHYPMPIQERQNASGQWSHRN
jgi:hypothetical protein